MCDETPDKVDYYPVGGEAPAWKGKAMRKKQKVADMAEEVLARQARTRVDRRGKPFEDALGVVLETGRQFGELRDGPHRDERSQEGLARERAEVLGWSSSNKGPGSPADVPQRGSR
jgi:hypothetical protein